MAELTTDFRVELPTEYDVSRLLRGLFDREVTCSRTDMVAPHVRAFHGLVDNENRLRYVIGSDLSFAHRSAAALAMLPVGMVDEAGDDPDDELLEVYHEVANLTSRAVNEAAHDRVRLDPGLEIPATILRDAAIAGVGLCLDLEIEGYGGGHLGIWQCR